MRIPGGGDGMFHQGMAAFEGEWVKQSSGSISCSRFVQSCSVRSSRPRFFENIQTCCMQLGNVRCNEERRSRRRRRGGKIKVCLHFLSRVIISALSSHCLYLRHFPIEKEQPLLRIILSEQGTIHCAKRASCHKRGKSQDRTLYMHTSWNKAWDYFNVGWGVHISSLSYVYFLSISYLLLEHTRGDTTLYLGFEF